MRIRSITIHRWRHFENISLALEPTASLVCVVGANGTGKSHILELIAASAHRLGLSQGIELPRGNPFDDPHQFSLQFHLAEGVSGAIDQGLNGDPDFGQWDRTLTLESTSNPETRETRVVAGGIADAQRGTQFAQRVTEALRNSQDVHFLSLDADRAYPKKTIQIHEIAQAYEINWEDLEYTRGRSYKTTTTLYDEWIKYFLAQENQSGSNLMQGERRAKKSGGQRPEFQDPFDQYSESLQKVLPHLLFTGVDPKHRTLLFDTTGLHLSFNQLSGGEREIAFLVGQIDRFRLREGIFLIDEPELHLNADLIRTWVAYLTGTVSVGQIWLATHSLEAVEAAGQQATFVLERNEQTRQVNSIARLDARPVLSALSRAVGTPAFSISQLQFVFIEGEEGVGERERYRRLANVVQSARFMECGCCNEVFRRVAAVKSLAAESRTEIRIGGIVDRDFRTDGEAETLTATHSVFVLPVHEAENYFLHPATLAVLLGQNGIRDVEAAEIIRDSADARAGSWVFQYALATRNAKTLPEINVAAKDRAKSLGWATLNGDRVGVIRQIADLSGFGDEDKERFGQILTISANAYERQRASPDLWKRCEGKQVLNNVARACGFAGSPAHTLASFAAWERDAALISEELALVRRYVAGL